MSYQSDEPPVEVSGGTNPAEFPHLCPYQRSGASKEICQELTTNYRRNLAGCCGTQDNRDFKPCNSVLRRCVQCLVEGKGTRAQIVVDVERGLCEEHKVPAGMTVEKKQNMQEPVHVSRLVSIGFVKTVPDVNKSTPVVVSPKAHMPAEPPLRIDIDACIERVPRLTMREYEVLTVAMAKKRKDAAVELKISQASLDAYMSTICNKLGLPKSDRSRSFDRIWALRAVWTRYQQMVAEGTLKAGGPSVAEQQEKLKDLFRRMTPEQIKQVLTYALTIKVGE